MKQFELTDVVSVDYECDVCVCGGGIAGIAAALSAAREGKRVILLERSFMLGGLATAGLVTIYLPLCDGEGTQVSYGIAEELLRLSMFYGAEDRYPDAWVESGKEARRCEQRYQVQFNAQFLALKSEELLLAEGVKIIYGATCSSVRMEDDRITHVVIEGKSGKQAVSVEYSVVDTTGDADICKLAGAKTAIYKGGEGNILAAWYYKYAEGKFGLKMLGYCESPDPKANSKPLVKRRYTGVETEELSEMMQDSHKAILNSIATERLTAPDTVPTTVSTIPQTRMTRRLVGEYSLDESEVFVSFPDSVGLFSDWRKRGPVFELPYRTLFGSEVKNLFAAGRCMSVTDPMWDITRVIPVCAVTGEAAGLAATMAHSAKEVDVAKLREKLTSRGVKLSVKDAVPHKAR